VTAAEKGLQLRSQSCVSLRRTLSGTPQSPHSLRPCWMAFLSSLFEEKTKHSNIHHQKVQRCTMGHVTKFIILLSLGLISSSVSAETLLPPAESTSLEKTPIFNENDYRSSDLAVSKKAYSHGDLKIKLIQVKRITGHEKQPSFLASPNEPPVYCRAWLTVEKNNKVLKEFYYADIHPVGSAYGLFIQKPQPSQEYFVVVTLGGYSGQLILIHKDGTFAEHLGGPYFITEDQKFLFSDYSSDESGLTVFDLAGRKVIFSSVIEPYIQNWYRSKLGYFFTETNFDTKWPYEEKKGVIHVFDFSAKSLVMKPIDVSDIKDAKRINYDFPYPREDNDDCSSQ
jgi:hypothetical protein